MLKELIFYTNIYLYRLTSFHFNINQKTCLMCKKK